MTDTCPVRDDHVHCAHWYDGDPCCACQDPTGPDPAPKPPVWLLDIDGVINACTPKPDPNVWPRNQWCRQEVNGFDILAAQPVLDFITEVHTGSHAEIRWHTTWQHDAQKVADAFNLPTLPVQDCPEFATRHATDLWFKLPAAERVVMQEARALVWTDDDISYARSSEMAAFNLMRQGQRILTICPSPYTGLTPKHLRLIREFLNMPAPAAAQPHSKAA